MSCKVLVVDDEVSVCKVLRKFLVSIGCEVVEAYGGDEALALYIKERPDVVLLDIRMPGKDGLETLREFKALDPMVKVIMVTAVHEEGLAKRTILEDGAFDYITKPVNPDYLEALIAKVILLGADEHN